MARDVPLRRSLLVRLLLVSALVSVCSVLATAWLTVRTTAVAIRQEQGQALADDARIYDRLLGYAATHRDWSGAAATVRELAASSGHRITLTDDRRHPLVDSAGPGARSPGLPAEASASLDPLSVDTALVTRSQSAGVPLAALPSSRPAPAPVPAGPGGTGAGTTTAPSSAGTIDARAVGPFALTTAERARLAAAAQRVATCLRDRLHDTVQVGTAPGGRPVISVGRGVLYLPTDCDADSLDAPTPTEARALKSLDALVDTCLDRHRAPHVSVSLDFGWTQRDPHTTGGDAVTASCVDTARREQLAPYVAPPALLFVSSPQRTASTFLDLSAGNRARIAEVTGLVLLITLAVTTLAGMRMVRPLRALALAARRMSDGDLTARVTVPAGDEIGSVAAAFNTMSERRQRSEVLRKAMVSDVAHELRTPLSNIRGWLEAAEDGLVVPDHALLSSLLEEAVLLQHVIDDLRDLAAADAGELRLHPEPVDVADLLTQVATAHRGSADAAGVRLVTAVESAAGERLFTVADPVRLRQAVGNLVSNALRHTPRGGTVTLRARREGDESRPDGHARPEGRTVIEVADTGTGISPEDLARVFDRFWRAEKSRGRGTGGSGLGLSIVRKLAEAHGGEATAASTPGRGSVFTLILPG